MSSPQVSSITLRAIQGAPLRDERIRSTVEATARAIAERTGIDLRGISMDDDAVTVELGADRLAALGFAAELRRVTGAWYAGKHAGESLWGQA